MELITRNGLADRLGIAKNSVTRLIDVGLVPQPTKAGAAIVWTESELESILHRRNPPSTHEQSPAVMVKVAPAEPVSGMQLPPPRTQIGWDRSLTPMDPVQMAGIDRWWRLDNPSRWIGDTFIVTSIGFVLAVYGIRDINTVEGMHQFILGPASAEGEKYEGVRFPSERGAMLKAWR